MSPTTVARIAKTIQQRLADVPPLRPDQIDRLTALLGGGTATN